MKRRSSDSTANTTFAMQSGWFSPIRLPAGIISISIRVPNIGLSWRISCSPCEWKLRGAPVFWVFALHTRDLRSVVV
jgi:hypothetical protein